MDVQSIGVFRALQLGDLLCAVPALRALRAAAPRARITLVGLAWARMFADRFSRYIDDFLTFPGWPGMPEQSCRPEDLSLFFADARARQFDLAVQMHGSGRIANAIVSAMGARSTAGFFMPGEACPEAGTYLPWCPEHEIRRYLRLANALGARQQGENLECPVDSADLDALRANPALSAVTERPYVIVHPGAQLPSRRWPADRFAAVADALAVDGRAIVLTGTAAEARLTSQVAAAMRVPAIDASGQTTLGSLAALVDRAELVVANDTGVGHVAVARRTPSVIVACGSDVERWRPLDTALHHVLYEPIDCRPCAHVSCPIGHPCATAISVDQVVAEARTMLPTACPPARVYQCGG